VELNRRLVTSPIPIRLAPIAAPNPASKPVLGSVRADEALVLAVLLELEVLDAVVAVGDEDDSGVVDEPLAAAVVVGGVVLVCVCEPPDPL
jgi:hypothetical protein